MTTKLSELDNIYIEKGVNRLRHFLDMNKSRPANHGGLIMMGESCLEETLVSGLPKGEGEWRRGEGRGGGGGEKHVHTTVKSNMNIFIFQKYLAAVSFCDVIFFTVTDHEKIVMIES